MLHLLCAEYGPPGELGPGVASVLYTDTNSVSLSTPCTWNPTTSWKLVYNEISTAGFESLIYDYKQETEGKTGIVWWKVKSNKSRP
jgi:hypothetical protein